MCTCGRAYIKGWGGVDVVFKPGEETKAGVVERGEIREAQEIPEGWRARRRVTDALTA